jgi:D-alanyl-lipoteichoic acid acyltransferase DltB (MBOAT superfamily)
VFSYLNFVITMLICGVWHGLGWAFALWGVYHGVLLAGYYAIRGRGLGRDANLNLKGLGSIALMLQLSVAGWVLFRLDRISDLPVYLRSLTSGGASAAFGPLEWLAVILLCAVALAHLVELAFPITQTALKLRWNPWVMAAMLTALLGAAVYGVPKQQLFFYFRF